MAGEPRQRLVSDRLQALEVEDGLERNDIGEAVLYYANDPSEVTRRLPPHAPHVSRGANLEDVFLRLTGHRLRLGD